MRWRKCAPPFRQACPVPDQVSQYAGRSDLRLPNIWQRGDDVSTSAIPVAVSLAVVAEGGPRWRSNWVDA